MTVLRALFYFIKDIIYNNINNVQNKNFISPRKKMKKKRNQSFSPHGFWQLPGGICRETLEEEREFVSLRIPHIALSAKNESTKFTLAGRLR